MRKKFALIGAAGYIAPRHFKAIKETGNDLIAALDTFDSVGVIDSFFPKADFFTEFERFDRHLDKKRRSGVSVDYLSICSPNYLHDSHVRFGLKEGADVICEKPLVLNPWNIESLKALEQETGKRIYNILQLRLHPSIIALRKKIEESHDKIWDVNLTYITSRGNWYFTSWKGDLAKSGGIATNIGVHFFDMLGWIFGEVKTNEIHVHTYDRAAGYLEFSKARVRWFLSINEDNLPVEARQKGLRTYRSISIEGENVEFSVGFNDLHTHSYRKVLEGEGFGLEEVISAISIVHEIRNKPPKGCVGEYHEMAKLPISSHPFSVGAR